MPPFEEVSRQVLLETPPRALKFVTGVCTSTPVRNRLATRGYNGSTNDLIWELIHLASGRSSSSFVPVSTEDVAARDAAVEVDLWDEPTFRIARVALKYDHPDACDYVFHDLEPASGADSLVSVTTFLDRLDELESGEGRKKTRKADHAALAKLAEREITPEQRARMRALVQTATRWTEASPEPVPDATREEALLKLRALYEEWSEIAKVVIRRRADLIRLGLAKRGGSGKRRKGAPEKPNGQGDSGNGSPG